MLRHICDQNRTSMAASLPCCLSSWCLAKVRHRTHIPRHLWSDEGVTSAAKALEKGLGWELGSWEALRGVAARATGQL
jgi:hypothetical protein